LGLFFGLVLLAIGLVWAGFDWPLDWFCHTDLATLPPGFIGLAQAWPKLTTPLWIHVKPFCVTSGPPESPCGKTWTVNKWAEP